MRRRAQVRQELTGGDWPELQALPLHLFEKLAQVLNLVEETGTWPVPLTRVLTSLVQKGEGSAPQKLRPIGLMASVYRLWASLRVRDIMHWEEKLGRNSIVRLQTWQTCGGCLDGSFAVCRICTC